MPHRKNNLLYGIEPKKKTSCLAVFVPFFILAIAAISLNKFALFAVLVVATIAFLYFLLHIEKGLLVVASVSFFTSLGIYFSQYEWSKRIPYLNAVDAPVVDFFALFLVVITFVALIAKILYMPLHRKKLLTRVLAIYGLFLCIGVISSIYAFEHRVGESVYYLVRTPFFIFVAYLLVPLAVLQEKKTAFSLLRVWFWVGFGSALFGISSLAFGQTGGFFRIQPYTIFGLQPLGTNHNVLAEVLVAILPISFYLAIQKNVHEEAWKQQAYRIGTVVILFAALFTLSRAAWIVIALLAAIIIAGSDQYRSQVKKYWNTYKPLFLAIIVLFAGYMAYFLGSSTAETSTTSRIITTEFAFYTATRSPIIGHGPGMFVPMLAQNYVYRIDFGEPLEAHGYMQKIVLEYGYVGLLIFTIFLLYIVFFLYKKYRTAHADDVLLFQAMFLMSLAVIGFQFFNTAYFSSVMWLPLGIALAVVTLEEE